MINLMKITFITFNRLLLSTPLLFPS